MKIAKYLPSDVDKIDAIGLTKDASQLVKSPRLRESPVHPECKLHDVLVLPGYSHQNTTHVVVSQLVGVHVRDDMLTSEGKLDVGRLRTPCTYWVSSVTEVFELARCGIRQKLISF